MTEIMGPPSSWYDPPEGHKDVCNCETCHQDHIKSGEFEELAKSPDFPCCKEELEFMLDEGTWCYFHGGGYIENKRCFECVYGMNRAVGE